MTLATMDHLAIAGFLCILVCTVLLHLKDAEDGKVVPREVWIMEGFALVFLAVAFIVLHIFVW